MTADLDLPAYFDRIGWHGTPDPTLATVRALLAAHMLAIPFENLDVLLGWPVRLDLDGVQAKLVRARRGGYCSEHATLFAAVLERLGFAPLRHSARVILMSPRTQSPRTHTFLSVTLPEGRFVLDPGFGGPAPQVPVLLADGGDAPPPDAKHWMVRDGDFWLLRTRSGEKVVDLWVTSLEEEHPIDLEMANHFTATHPTSPFLQRLMMSRFGKEGRVTVHNCEATIRQGDATQTILLADRKALRTFIAEHFGFDLPEVETLHIPSIPGWG